jgi:hypothetical protein
MPMKFLRRSGSAGRTITTIERPSRDRFSNGPFIYVRSTAFGFVSSRVFTLDRGDNCIQAHSTKNRLVPGLGSSFGEPHLSPFGFRSRILIASMKSLFNLFLVLFAAGLR